GGLDYAATSGTGTIAAGQTSTVVAVPVVGNATATGNLTFQLQVSNPVGASLSDGASSPSPTVITGVGTIIDPNGAPSVSVGNAPTLEGPAGATTGFVFPVVLSNPGLRDITVSFQVSVNAAAGPTDATPADFPFAFAGNAGPVQQLVI